MSGVIFVVTKYECLIENKNVKKIFRKCKQLKKNIEPHQNFIFSQKKRRDTG